MNITDFEILYAEPSDDGKSFSARLGIDTLRQEMWLLDQVGVSEKDDAIEYPIEARVVLSCDRKCRLYVQDVNHTPVGECRLSADEVRQVASKLAGYVYQTGVSAPRWLVETTLPPLDVPSFNLSGTRLMTFGQEIQYECNLHPLADELFMQTLAQRCDISCAGLTINDATLCAQINSDLTIDASVKFGGSINGVYGGVTTVKIELTEKERKDILEDAMKHKLRMLEQIEHEWHYLNIPLGYERDEQERERIPEPKSDKTPRNRDGFER